MHLPASLRDLGIEEARTWRIPMTTRFRGITRREGVLLRGPQGWAEFSPFREYLPPEAVTWLRAALADATTPRPPALRESIEINATIPVVPAETAHRIALVGGARTAKVKVADPASTLAEDASRLRAVREALGPAGKVRIDANAAWDREQALRALPLLDAAAGGLEYAEQPCASLEDLAALRRALDVPIAADESVRRAEDPLRVVRAEAADLLVMKVQPLGGVRRALDLAAEAGLPVVVSSALESSIGLSAGLALAASLPTLAHACGLATATLLTGDLTPHPLHARSGALPVARPEPAPALLDQHSAPAELVREWEQRLTDCAALL